MVDVVLRTAILKSEVPKYAVIVGDPDRVHLLGELLSDVTGLRMERGYVGIRGFWKGEEVAILTHGMSGSSAVIVLEEAIKLGAKYFIRLGTVGGMLSQMDVGDCIIPTSAAYYPGGLYSQYFDECICGPAVPDYMLLTGLIERASDRGIKYYVGPIISSEALYSEDPEFVSRWVNRGVIGVEMECASLFILGKSKAVSVAALLVISNSLVKTGEWLGTKELRDRMLTAGEIVLDTLISIRDNASS